MKTKVLIAGLVVALFSASTAALAHDADPLAAGSQAHQIGSYRVVDQIVHDVDNESTTVSYTVTVPDGAADLGHLSLRLADCHPQHLIEESTPGGQVEPKGDPSTGTPGPVLKWTGDQRSGETRTYHYRVSGFFRPEEGELVLKSRDAFRGVVERISCDRLEPPPCALTGPGKAASSGGTLITIGLDCERVSGARKINHGFPALGDDLGPLFQFRAESPMGGPDVFRMTDRFYNEATGGTDTLKFAKEIFLAIPVGKVCVTVAGSEKCSP